MKPYLILPLMLAASGVAYANNAALLKCRGVFNPQARLQCYDAITPGPAGPAPATAPAGVAAGPATGAPPATAAAARAPGPAPVAGTPQQNFGIEDRVQQATASQVTSIESRIPGRFEGWAPNARIQLANGQVWQIADGSTRRGLQYDNAKVVVRRGFMGAFFLEIEGDNRAPRVRRVE